MADGRVPCIVPPRCIECGYDLRGRGADDVCPECGQPVAPSLAFRGHRHAGVEALRRLRRRTLVAAAAYPTAIFLVAVVIVLVNLGVRYAAGVLSETFVTAALVAMLSGVLALGTWRARNVPGPWHGRRVFAWSMAGASLTAFLFSTTLALIVDRATAFVAPRMWFFIVMSAVPAIALLLPVFAGATLVGGLARAIPSRPMVKLGRAAAGCLLSGIVLVTATNTATLLGAWTRTESLVVGWGGLLLLLTGVAGVCTVTILLHRAAGRVLVDAVEAEAEAKLNAAAGRPTGVADAAG